MYAYIRWVLSMIHAAGPLRSNSLISPRNVGYPGRIFMDMGKNEIFPFICFGAAMRGPKLSGRGGLGHSIDFRPIAHLMNTTIEFWPKISLFPIGNLPCIPHVERNCECSAIELLPLDESRKEMLTTSIELLRHFLRPRVTAARCHTNEPQRMRFFLSPKRPAPATSSYPNEMGENRIHTKHTFMKQID